MKNFSEVLEKLKDILSKEQNKRIFDKDIAHELGITQANLATLKSRNKIPYQQILDFCARKKISINWLLYNQAPESLIETTNSYWIRYYPNINLSAGGGAEFLDEKFEMIEIPQNILSDINSNELQNIEAINIIGDSMEPILFDGNIALINRKKTDINKGGIFAFVSSNGLFVKRLHKRIDGKIDVISENKEYPKQKISLNEISILGKIIGSFGRIRL